MIVRIRFFNLVVLAVVFLGLTQYYSCKNGGVAPPEEPCPPPPKLDSTSHNFTFQLDTIGDGNASTLNDVFVINDTLAYAVGEVYLKDSTGQYDPNAYNLVKWDGKRWQLIRIQFLTFCGQAHTGSYPTRAIYAFSGEDVWIASGSQIVRWNGQNQTAPMCIPVSVVKLWGQNANSMWAVGYAGGVAYYNGSSWQKLASPTTIDIQDIWGGVNCKGELEILAVASNGPSIPQAKALLRISGTTVTKVNDTGLSLSLSAVWFVASQKYYAGGDGLFTTAGIGSAWTQEQNVPFYYAAAIRGLGLNDIVWAGGLGSISHFNGSSWRHYAGTEIPFIQGNYYAVANHPKLIVAVGYVGQKAVALVGKR